MYSHVLLTTSEIQAAPHFYTSAALIEEKWRHVRATRLQTQPENNIQLL